MLEDLIISLSFPQDPRLSPDGRWVAWVATPYGQSGEHPEGSIWLAPVDGSRPARQVTFGGGRDDTPRWSPDGRRLAFRSDREKRGVGGLYLLSARGGDARLLVQRERAIAGLEWSPDGTRIAYLVPDDPTADEQRREDERDDPDVHGERWAMNRLWVLDVASSESTVLSAGNVHVAECAWAPDGRRIAYIPWPTPELESHARNEIRVISLVDGASTLVCKPPHWAPFGLQWFDNQTLLFLAGHDDRPQGSFSAFAVPSGGGTARVIGTTVEENACTAGLLGVPASGRVVITIASDLTSRLEWADPARGTREPLFQPESGDFSQASAVLTPGGPIIAVVASSGENPPEVHAGPPGSLRRLSDHHAPLRAFELGAQEELRWTAPDGMPISGVLIRPAGDSVPPYPLIVLPHGGPYGRSTLGWNLAPLRWGPWLAAHGYAALLPNYRGGLGRGHRFATMARGKVGLGDFEDVMAGVDAAIDHGIADPERLGIGGWSQGGFMTAWAVTQTKRFKAGVMGAGVSDWGMMTMTSDMPTFESSLSGDRPWDGPGPHRAAQLSPISFAGNVETPLLILHGKNDERVPVSQAVGFARALRERGVPVEMVTYPREPHGIRERNHQRDILRRVLAWYDRWLKGDPSQPGTASQA